MLDGLGVSDLEGRVNLLLGQICLSEMRPEEALAFFANVIQRHAHSELEIAASLGSAEAMAMVRRYESARKTYERSFEVLEEVGPNLLVDRDMIVESIRAQAKALAKDGQLDQALTFGELEHRHMSQEQDDPARHELLKRLGEWYSRKGRHESARLARVGTSEYADEIRRQMNDSYSRAGAMFLQLAGAKGLSDTDSADALWMAALAYRDAGDARTAGQLFARFVNDWPANMHLPQALFNLAQSYQASGRPSRAIEYYQRLVDEFPRTPVGLRSLVPMAQCYMMAGPELYPKAEAILRQIVDDSANQNVLTPKAREFRSALFLLGKLYYFQGDYEKCVGRLEEALQRYPDDVDVPETRFVIAQSYRKLAATFKDQVSLTNDRTMRDQLMRNWKDNMLRATDLFVQAIQTLSSVAQTSRLEQTYLKLATIWYADCLYDLERYGEAIAAYERVVDKYEKDPVALAAYLQVVNCYERQGRRGKIKAVLERMKWLVQQLPETAFTGPSAMLTRQEWLEWIDWNYRSGMLQDNDESTMAEAMANGAR
jgi:tetratricopeptide (TPR) repeat protein